MEKWQVTKQESGTKLLAFLRNKLGTAYSSRVLKLQLESNLCTVNNRIERFGSTLLGNGDTVAFRMEEIPESKKSSRKYPSHIPLNVLYEDDYYLILDKPIGRTSDDPLLLQNFQGTDLTMRGGSIELMHRLDRETSGVLIFAKTTVAANAMLQLFKTRKIQKRYLAIVHGIPKQDMGSIENYLGKLHSYVGQNLWGVVKREQGSKAITEWRIISKGNKSTLLACCPLTGRTHQIRVHLNDMGHAILGDKQYSKKPTDFSQSYHPKRCLLHAQSIKFVHPMTNRELIVEAPLPLDFQEAMKALKLL